jgi:hypothetical protein
VSEHEHTWEIAGYLDKPWYTWKYFGYAIRACTKCGAYTRGHLANGDDYPVAWEPIQEFIGPLIPEDTMFGEAWQATYRARRLHGE